MQSKMTVVRVMAWVKTFGIIHSQYASERFSGKLNSIWGGMEGRGGVCCHTRKIDSE